MQSQSVSREIAPRLYTSAMLRQVMLRQVHVAAHCESSPNIGARASASGCSGHVAEQSQTIVPMLPPACCCLIAKEPEKAALARCIQ